jgi:trigger factor
LSSVLERLSSTRVKLTISVPAADLKPALDKAYRQIAAQMTVPGFRKGHVPAAVIDQRVGRRVVLNEALDDVLPPAYTAAVKENGLVPLAQPTVDIVTLEAGQDVEFTAEVDVRPDFDLPPADQLAVTVKDLLVEDSAVEERIELMRERFAETKDVDRAAQAGDQITLDLVGSQNGETLPDATADGVTYVIGSGGMLDGLDEAVTGLKAGESKKFTSTLVGGDHEGETADVAVTVVKVAERTLPEVDDDFAQIVSSFDTADEMRADLKAAVERMAQYAQAEEAREKIVDAALAAVSFELPEAVLKREVEARTDSINQTLQRANLPLKTYLDRQGDKQTPEEFWQGLEDVAVRELKTRILLDKVADEIKAAATESDLTQYVLRRAQENGTNVQDEVEHMRQHGHMMEWLSDIRRSKALTWLLNQARVVDESGRLVDLAVVFGKPEEPAGEAEPEGVKIVDIA